VATKKWKAVSWRLKKIRLPKLKGGVTTADRKRWKRELGNSAKWGQGGKNPTLNIK
jgi:hypothetical protein